MATETLTMKLPDEYTEMDSCELRYTGGGDGTHDGILAGAYLFAGTVGAVSSVALYRIATKDYREQKRLIKEELVKQDVYSEPKMSTGDKFIAGVQIGGHILSVVSICIGLGESGEAIRD